MIARELFDQGALNVTVFEIPELGDRSYLVHDGTVGVVIDAQRDHGPYLEHASDKGLEITHVFETHIHNDFVSGGLALARCVKATYVVPRFEAVAFSELCTTAGDDDVFETGSLTIRVIATAGHSAHHVSYVIESTTSSERFVATGGSLLAGTTGRTDLFGSTHTMQLALSQWRSVRKLLRDCSPETIVLPTHGFGSFCAASTVTSRSSELLTIGDERGRNPASNLGPEEFVSYITGDPLPIPTYYNELSVLNRRGLEAPSFGQGPAAELGDLEARLAARRWLIDLRPRRDFAALHRTGTVNFELGTNLVTYLGWLVPRSEPLTLLGDAEDSVLDARRLLALIAREEIDTWSHADVLPNAPTPRSASSYPVEGFDALAAAREQGVPHLLLDVRHAHEWRNAHIKGARHLALPDLRDHLGDIDAEDPIWVHCGAGYRAAIAASLLEGAGLHPVLIDDDFANAKAAGLPIIAAGDPDLGAHRAAAGDGS